MNESEPLTTPRKAQLLPKPWGYATMGQVQRKTAYCLNGNRGKGGMNLIQAQIRNMRTSILMVTEKPQVKDLRGRNTEVVCWGGTAYSSDETLVMRMEQRSCITLFCADRQPYYGRN